MAKIIDVSGARKTGKYLELPGGQVYELPDDDHRPDVEDGILPPGSVVKDGSLIAGDDEARHQRRKDQVARMLAAGKIPKHAHDAAHAALDAKIKRVHNKDK